jgi:two-component system sensor kinase FixL
MITLSGTGLVLGATVSERQRVVAQLDETYRHLQESQSALYQASRVSLASEMAASLAHDLNQPLTSARNFIRTIRRKLDARRLDRAALVTNIDAAVQQVDAAAALIRATRTFLERGDVHRESTNLEIILRETTALTSTELERSGVVLSRDGDRAIPPVMANPTQIQQVLINLIRNAKEAIVEANPTKRQVSLSVSAKSRPGFVEITVDDTGPGIPESMRPLLFNPVRSAKPEGLGLGLALCKTIVTAHGGELWLASKEGHGARFCFTLPIAERRSR